MAVRGRRLAARYRLLQPIAAGGMATVWRARDERLGRVVAVKLLRPELASDPEFVRRFEMEARHAASVSHPNIANVYDTGSDDGEPFIVMELVDGPTVADVLRQQGRIDAEAAVTIAAAAARALAAAHRRGLIHRDVKPDNLLLDRDGRVRLADFGIARALTTSRATSPGTILGSIPYLSPEQARGEEPTPATDIFSLGVVLFEMLTGRLPWDADTPAAMTTARLQVAAPPPSSIRPNLPTRLDAIVGKALRLEPRHRYTSARTFADALETRLRRASATGEAPTRIERAAAAVAGVARATRPSTPVTAGAGQPRTGTAARARTGRGTGSAITAAGEPEARVAAAAAPSGAAGIARPNPGAIERTPVPPTRVEAGSSSPRPRDGDSSLRRIEPAPLLLVLLGLAVVLGIFAVLQLSAPGSTSPGSSLPAVVVAPSWSFSEASTAPSPVPSAARAPTPKPTATRKPARTPTPTRAPTPAPPVVAPATPTNPQRAGPSQTVAAFYTAVARHDWDRAIAIWSPRMRQQYPPSEWLIDRFRYTTRIVITRLGTVALNEAAGTAKVAVSLIEYRSVEPSPRTFVGSWDLVRIDGLWYLDQPHF